MPRPLTALTLIVIVACGLVSRALWDGPVVKYAGDALYTAAIYAVVLLALPKVRPWVAAAVSAGLSWLIEFAQLGDIPQVLQPLLGSTFNPPDLLWYAIGGAACWAAHTSGLSHKRLGAESREQL